MKKKTRQMLNKHTANMVDVINRIDKLDKQLKSIAELSNRRQDALNDRINEMAGVIVENGVAVKETDRRIERIEQTLNKLDGSVTSLGLWRETVRECLNAIEEQMQVEAKLTNEHIFVTDKGAENMRHRIEKLEAMTARISDVNISNLNDRVVEIECRLDGAGEDRAKILEKYSDWDDDWDIPTPRDSLIKSFLRNNLEKLMSETKDLPADGSITISAVGEKHNYGMDLTLGDLRKMTLAMDIRGTEQAEQKLNNILAMLDRDLPAAELEEQIEMEIGK